MITSCRAIRAALLLAALLLASGCGRRLTEVKVSQMHMGMQVDLIVWAPSVAEGQKACATAFERIGQLNLIFSDYEADSEVSRLCRESGRGPVKVSHELFTVLETAQRIARLTDGHYDVTAAPVIRLWRQARRDHVLPTRDAVAGALESIGYGNLVLDAHAQTATLAKSGMLLDLGSIAKGYIGDEAIASLRSQGIRRAAFIAGGDMVFGDAPPGKQGWPVNPAKPGLREMEVANCGFSVSGDTEQFVEIGGQRFSHVIDARTGWALTDRRMCMVQAPAGLISDTLSTVGTILPAKEFDDLTRRHFKDVRTW